MNLLYINTMIKPIYKTFFAGMQFSFHDYFVELLLCIDTEDRTIRPVINSSICKDASAGQIKIG